MGSRHHEWGVPVVVLGDEDVEAHLPGEILASKCVHLHRGARREPHVSGEIARCEGRASSIVALEEVES